MNNDYDSIRNQVEERVKKRQKVKSNLRSVIFLNGLVWFLMFTVPSMDINERLLGNIFPLLLILTAIWSAWGIYAIWKWFTVTYVEPRRERRLQDEIEQEFERELAKRPLTEKRKNLALSDDGELVEITEDDGEPLKRGNELYN